MSESSTTAESTVQGSVGKTQYVRVAVAQLEYHPAIIFNARSPLMDPGGLAFFLPPKEELPDVLWNAYDALCGRIRTQYTRYMARRVKRILQQCDAWGVRVMVFPEYSIPWQILPELAKAAPNIVVVAGTHTVEKNSKEVYTQLGWSKEKLPKNGQALAPVLYGGQLIGLSGKFNAAVAVGEEIKPATSWQPIEMPSGIPGPMGVMVCLDFLYRENDAHRTLVGDKLDDCHFLAIPSLTPSRTVERFEDKGWEEVKGYGRPVLYTNDSKEGGATIFVDEKERSGLTPFPEHVGCLVAKDEGVVVADVDLGFKRAGGSGRLDAVDPVKPFAMASLVYRARPAENDYAVWLDGLRAIVPDDIDDLEDDDMERFHAHVRGSKGILTAAGKGSGARGDRLRKLNARLENITFVEDARRLTREVVLEPQVLPFGAFCAAVARGAAREVARWVAKDGQLGPVLSRLREPWDKLEREMATWTQQAQLEAADVVRAVGGPEHEKMVPMSVVAQYEDAAITAFEQANKDALAELRAGRHEEGRARYRDMLQRARAMIDAPRPEDVEINAELRKWATRCELMIASASMNLQERETALEMLLAVNAANLTVRGKIQLANAWSQMGDIERAKLVFPEEKDVPSEDRQGWLATQQLIQLAEGKLSAALVEDALVWARAAGNRLQHRDYAGAAERGLSALQKSKNDKISKATAIFVLVETLRQTVFDEPPSTMPIPFGTRREELVDSLDAAFDSLRGETIADVLRTQLVQSEKLFRLLTLEPPAASFFLVERSSAVDDEQMGILEVDSRVLELARQGRMTDAQNMLPQDEHPWTGALARVELLQYANRLDEAWELAKDLVNRWEGRAPIEWEFAHLCIYRGMRDEALPHAERAFAEFPGIGQRLLLARIRSATGDDVGAWRLLEKHANDERAEVQQTRAAIAQRLGKDAEAIAALRRYLAKRPEDARMYVPLATTLYRFNKVEEAAAIAWNAFENHCNDLDVDSLYACGWLQGVAGLHRVEHTRRVKAIVDKLKNRFPGDARANKFRFQLVQRLDELPEEIAEDLDPWAKQGLLEVMPVETGIARLKAQQAITENLYALARQGDLPMMVTARYTNTESALFIRRLLERSRTADASRFLCPPVILSDEPPPIQLKGAKILVSDLELALLVALNLKDVLREALGNEGRLILFNDARERMLSDAADLRLRRDRLDTPAEERAACEDAQRAHEWLQEPWVQVGKKPPANDLPPFRETTPEVLSDLFREPLENMVAYRRALELHPDWWHLTADQFGATRLAMPDVVTSLAWPDQDAYMSFARRMQVTTTRDLTIPMLVRLLLPSKQDSASVLHKLAKLGFPDAVGPDEVLQLEQRYGGLHSDEPKRILDAQEWIAKEPIHASGALARTRLAHTYARAIFDGYAQSHRTPAERIALIDALMGRVESIANVTCTEALDQVFMYLAGLTADKHLLLWQQDAEQKNQYTLRKDHPIFTLWQDLYSWSGENGSRQGSRGRALRHFWRALAQHPGGPPAIMVATIWHANVEAFSIPERDDWLATPEIEALAILSARWKKNPFEESKAGDIINFAVRTFAEISTIDNPRHVRFGRTYKGALRTLVFPIEALFLRLSDDERQQWIEPLQMMQGIYDGIAYQRLQQIKDAPDSPESLDEYADHAAGALFRMVQDDPAFLAIWPEVSFGDLEPLNKFERLLEILSEPRKPFDETQSLFEILAIRMNKGGHWHHRIDNGRLFEMATEIPGFLPSMTIAGHFVDEAYPSHVKSALDRLDHPDEHPAGRLAADMFFLRAAAAFRPLVRIAGSDIDLRDELPGRFHRLLLRVIDEPKKGSLAAFEPALLQCCASVIQRLAGHPLPIQWGVWLSWRLFQWLCLQLEAISPDARLAGMQRLTAHVPQFGAPMDRLDPAGFGRNKFDHRLAAVLHALGGMDVAATFARESVENVLKAGEFKMFDGPVRNVSSPEIEQSLMSLVQKPWLEVTLTSKLDWNAPGSMPDLALFALLGMNATRFADLSAETRTRCLEKLPQDLASLEQSNAGDAELAHRVIFAAANGAAKLTADERKLLEDKLVAMHDHPRVPYWRWFVFTCLYVAGEDHLEEPAWQTMHKHLGGDFQNALAGVSRLLLATANRKPEQLEERIEFVMNAAKQCGADAGALVAGGLARIVGAGKPASKKMGRKLLAKLAKHPELGNHPSMREVRGFFGIKEAAS